MAFGNKVAKLRLSDRDLRFWADIVSPEVTDKTQLKQIIGGDEDYRNKYVGDKKVFRRVMGEYQVNRNILKSLMILVYGIILFSCTQQRPVLYPNAKLNQAGKQAAEADIDACLQLAIDHGAEGDGGTRVAKDTAKGAAIGGAAGTAIGAVTGNLGRGAAAGAAGGGAASMTRSVIDSGKPDPVFKNFVDQCLRDKGYQPVGWR